MYFEIYAYLLLDIKFFYPCYLRNPDKFTNFVTTSDKIIIIVEIIEGISFMVFRCRIFL